MNRIDNTFIGDSKDVRNNVFSEGMLVFTRDDKKLYIQENGALEPINDNIGVQTLQAGTNITIDDTDPANPIINATGGNYIPLTGTEVGSPVTGTIELSNDYNTIVGTVNNIQIGVGNDLNVLDEATTKSIIDLRHSDYNSHFTIQAENLNYSTTLTAFEYSNQSNIIIHSTNPLSKGLHGGIYFGANYDDNTYVQKKYVKEGKGVFTVTTLPTGVLGDKAIVTDATAPTYLGVLVGGGSVTCPVWFNGTIWVSN